MADLGFDETTDKGRNARRAASVYAAVVDELVACRKRIGLSQKKVAKLMSTTQSAVSEFECVNADARFSTLLRYAQAVDCDLVIELEHQPKTAAWVTVKMTDHANVIPFESARFRQSRRTSSAHFRDISFKLEALG